MNTSSALCCDLSQLVDGDHDIDCKIAGIGAMKLKFQTNGK